MEKERQEMAQLEVQHKQAEAATIRADADRALRRDELEFRNRELALREKQEEERNVMFQLLIQQLSKK